MGFYALSGLCVFLNSVGPLDGESEYSVTAEKEGFTFSTMESEPLGHFKSFKLGRIHVQVCNNCRITVAFPNCDLC